MKKQLKSMTRDIGMFSVGSMVGGAGAISAGALGQGAAVSGVTAMMPAMGSLMMTKHIAGMSGSAMKSMKFKKRK